MIVDPAGSFTDRPFPDAIRSLSFLPTTHSYPLLRLATGTASRSARRDTEDSAAVVNVLASDSDPDGAPGALLFTVVRRYIGFPLECRRQAPSELVTAPAPTHRIGIAIG